MNIGLLTYTLSERSGSRAPIRLAESLRERGHSLTVYAFDYQLDTRVQKRLEEAKITIRLYSSNNNRWVPFSLRGWGLLFRLKSDLQVADHDVISFHATLPMLVAAYLTKAIIVKTYYGIEFSYLKIRALAGLSIQASLGDRVKSKLIDTVLIFQEKIAFTLCSEIVAISQFLAGEAQDLFGRPFKVIYLGAEAAIFQESLKTSEENYLLAVSRLVPYKGFDLLIEAFRKAGLADLKLVIVGSAANQEYVDYLKSLGNQQVEIKSGLSDQELADLYAGCLFYVSADLWVPWSLTPLEASFFGKPLVALKTGAMAEIITAGKNGLLATNLEELTDQIKRLYENKQLRQKMSEGSRLLVKRYQWQKTAQEYELLFSRLIEEK